MHSQEEADMLACIPSLRRYAMGLTADRDRADDLVQDTLERAWSKWNLWQRRGDIRAWMFGIMRNHFIDGVRVGKHQPTCGIEDIPESIDRARQTDALEVRDLERALLQLPQEQREVLLLIAIEELSYRDAAQALGVPIGTVMSRLSRARDELREKLRTAAGDSDVPSSPAANRIHRVK